MEASRRQRCRDLYVEELELSIEKVVKELERARERNREIKMVRVRAGVVPVLFLLVACFSFQQLFASDDTVMNLTLLLPLQLLEF